MLFILDIPISAQVVSVADVYDALTSDRVYKRAFSHEKAMQDDSGWRVRTVQSCSPAVSGQYTGSDKGGAGLA